MLAVAKGLISRMVSHRESTGVDLHGRIGVSVGPVISGVLGVLQPRFVVYGPAMTTAADLESTGKRDAVHCSSEFLECICRVARARRRSAFSAELAFMQQQNRRASGEDIDVEEDNADQHPRAGNATNAGMPPRNHRGSGSQQIGSSGSKGYRRRVRERQNEIVDEMLAEGLLYVQQNMMDAAPTGAFAESGFVPKRRDSWQHGAADRISWFGLRTAISRDGNYVASWHGDAPNALRKSIDCEGMFQLLRSTAVSDTARQKSVLCVPSGGEGVAFGNLATMSVPTLSDSTQISAHEMDRPDDGQERGLGEYVPSEQIREEQDVCESTMKESEAGESRAGITVRSEEEGFVDAIQQGWVEHGVGDNGEEIRRDARSKSDSL